MATFTKDQVTKHLISLGVKQEHIFDGWYEGRLKIRGEVVPIDPIGTPTFIEVNIDFSSGMVAMSSHYRLEMGDTKYENLNRYFDKRIKEAYSRMMKVVAATKKERIMADHKTQEMKDKFADLFRKGGRHLIIYPSSTSPTMYFSWFGSTYNVDTQSGEVCLGYGTDRVRVPIEVAVEFLNECEVYKLLEG